MHFGDGHSDDGGLMVLVVGVKASVMVIVGSGVSEGLLRRKCVVDDDRMRFYC